MTQLFAIINHYTAALLEVSVTTVLGLILVTCKAQNNAILSYEYSNTVEHM